jgi:anti-sigma28 factor (negative regulator of flagellin synthesis)
VEGASTDKVGALTTQPPTANARMKTKGRRGTSDGVRAKRAQRTYSKTKEEEEGCDETKVKKIFEAIEGSKDKGRLCVSTKRFFMRCNSFLDDCYVD